MYFKCLSILVVAVAAMAITTNAQLAPALKPDYNKSFDLYKMYKQAQVEVSTTQVFPKSLLPSTPDAINQLGEIYNLHSGGMSVLKPFINNPPLPNAVKVVSGYPAIEHGAIPNPYGIQNRELQKLLAQKNK